MHGTGLVACYLSRAAHYSGAALYLDCAGVFEGGTVIYRLIMGFAWLVTTAVGFEVLCIIWSKRLPLDVFDYFLVITLWPVLLPLLGVIGLLRLTFMMAREFGPRFLTVWRP